MHPHVAEGDATGASPAGLGWRSVIGSSLIGELQLRREDGHGCLPYRGYSRHPALPPPLSLYPNGSRHPARPLRRVLCIPMQPTAARLCQEQAPMRVDLPSGRGPWLAWRSSRGPAAEWRRRGRPPVRCRHRTGPFIVHETWPRGPAADDWGDVEGGARSWPCLRGRQRTSRATAELTR